MTQSNARFVTDVTIPDDTVITAGKSFKKTWRVKNIGDTTWGPGFQLAYVKGEAMTTKTSQAVHSVAPNQLADLSVDFTAPATPGTYFSDWRLKDPQGNEFGDIVYVRIVVEPKPAVKPAGVSNGRFCEDVTIPDNTEIAPGAAFTKTWRVENNGGRPWGKGFTLNFIGGTAMTTTTSIPLPPLAPDARGEISLNLKAPDAPGPYYGDWRMKDDQGNPFGQVLYLKITIPSPAGTTITSPISQRDPLWINKKLGYSSSNKTIGEWGCLMTCLTMVANRFGYSITPSQFNDAMLRRDGFIQPNLTKWNALNNVYQDIVYEGKIDQAPDILNRINASLAQGNPVTIRVDFTSDTPYTENDQHWVLVVGRDGDDYRINDPWLVPPQEASLKERYGRTGQPLKNSILSAIFYRCAKITKPVPVATPTPTPTAPVSTPTVHALLQTGMNVNPDAPNSNPMDNDDLKGMDWVRYVFKLAARENVSERDDINKAFAQFDEIISKYDRMGIKSLIVLNQETVWGNAPWSGNNDWNTYAGQLADVARQIATRYKRYGEKVAYEIWNEGDLPNNPASIYVEPEQFAIVLKRVADAIRSESPDSPLIFGGLATGVSQSIPYLKRCLKALNGKWPVDAIGIHPYGAWATRAPFDWGNTFGPLSSQFDLYRKEIPGITFWITEIGVAADSQIGPPHYATIGDYIKDVYKYVGERYLDLVPVVIWFGWSDWLRNAGIVEHDGRKKEHVYDGFRAVRNREL